MLKSLTLSPFQTQVNDKLEFSKFIFGSLLDEYAGIRDLTNNLILKASQENTELKNIKIEPIYKDANKEIKQEIKELELKIGRLRHLIAKPKETIKIPEVKPLEFGETKRAPRIIYKSRREVAPKKEVKFGLNKTTGQPFIESEIKERRVPQTSRSLVVYVLDDVISSLKNTSTSLNPRAMLKEYCIYIARRIRKNSLDIAAADEIYEKLINYFKACDGSKQLDVKKFYEVNELEYLTLWLKNNTDSSKWDCSSIQTQLSNSAAKYRKDFLKWKSDGTPIPETD